MASFLVCISLQDRIPPTQQVFFKNLINTAPLPWREFDLGVYQFHAIKTAYDYTNLT